MKQILTPIIVCAASFLLSGMIFLAWRHNHLQRSRGKISSSLLTSFGNLFKRRALSVIHQNRNETWVIDGQRDRVDSKVIQIHSSLCNARLLSSHQTAKYPYWSTTSVDTASSRNAASIFPRHRFTIRRLGERVKNLVVSWFGARPVLSIGSQRGHSRSNSYLKSPSSREGGYETLSEIEDDQKDPSVIIIGDPPEVSSDSHHNDRTQSPQKIGTVGAAADNPKSPSVDLTFEPPSPSDVTHLTSSPTVRQLFQLTQILDFSLCVKVSGTASPSSSSPGMASSTSTYEHRRNGSANILSTPTHLYSTRREC